MKYILTIIFPLLLFSASYCQTISISTFISLFGKEISYIDDVFTNEYRSELDKFDEKNGNFSWKKGFNGDRSQNNEYIIYKNLDSSFEFSYVFVTGKYYGRNNLKTYDDYYNNELGDSKYKKLGDTIEQIGEYKAIVKNYQFEKYLIKKYKLASTNSTVIKVIQE
jgi:hypothetical protein